LPPEQSIGPFYRIVGILVIIGMFVLKFYEVKHNHTLNEYDAIEYGLLLFVALSFIRPTWFDNLMRGIATALPGWITKYEAGKLPNA
jgi:hypothetical protein